MDVVYSDEELKGYIEEAVRVSPDKPILVDEFLADAVELDVDAVADGEDVLIGGVMEHVESAGVHSVRDRVHVQFDGVREELVDENGLDRKSVV